MKRWVRGVLSDMVEDEGTGPLYPEEAQDILDSDARQRARIRDLEARVGTLHVDGIHSGKCVASAHTNKCDGCHPALDLKNKKWRK